MRFYRLFLAATLSLMLLGCAARHPARSNYEPGHFGYTSWPDCTVNKDSSLVKCKCAEFAVSLDGKTGNTVMKCPKNKAQ